MRVYRASRRPRLAFDPLDASASVARHGWRYNDSRTEILYTAGVEALAILEVTVRPGWETVDALTVAAIDVPDGSIADLDALGIALPTNWNMRPAAPTAQRIGAEFLAAIDRGAAVCGVRVPSVVSSSDANVLLDPRQKGRYRVAAWSRMPFEWLATTPT